MESRPYMEDVTITPQVAQMMLEHNTHNRNLTENRARRYARDMAAGHWQYTGEAIKFAEDGTLLDGQTRLRAIILSGVTLVMPVWRGIDPKAQLVMDSGRPRSNADALALAGKKDRNSLSAVACADYKWCHYSPKVAFNNDSAHCVSQSEMFDWLAIRPDLEEATRKGNALNKANRDITRTVYGVLWYEFGLISTADRDRFFDDFAEGIGHSATDPLVALRRAAAASHASQKIRVNTAQYRAALVIKAWNAFRDGAETKALVWRQGTAFPLPH